MLWSKRLKFETILNKMDTRYFIRLAYDGARYHGWQIQENALSVQEVINKALGTVWDKDIRVTGCGRTDTGVNATTYYAHFDTGIFKERADLNKLVFRLNRYLPEDIVIFDIFPVPPGLHARHDAISRTYEYRIHQFKDPFLNKQSWYVNYILDLYKMNQAGEILKEYEDFTSFSKFNEKRKTNLCSIMEARWEREGHRIYFHITANRFLHDMVRAIVGTMVLVGRHKATLEDFRKIIESRDRCAAGESVPARGLYLSDVKYEGLPESYSV